MWGNPGLFFQKHPCEATAKLRRRPKSGRRCSNCTDNARRRLGALLLTVALPYFTFRVKPVFGLGAGCGSALQVEFVGAARDLILKINWNHVLADGSYVFPGLCL